MTTVVETVGPCELAEKITASADRLPSGEGSARGRGAVFGGAAPGHRCAYRYIAARSRPDLAVIAGMGWLLDEAALAVPRLGTLNVHPALLPAYRGAEPLFWQLFDGITESGVTVHLVESG